VEDSVEEEEEEEVGAHLEDEEEVPSIKETRDHQTQYSRWAHSSTLWRTKCFVHR